MRLLAQHRCCCCAQLAQAPEWGAAQVSCGPRHAAAAAQRSLVRGPARLPCLPECDARDSRISGSLAPAPALAAAAVTAVVTISDLSAQSLDVS